ncbi:hypothetical protein PF005_g3665 [Phytophthora fragariae]|uniref:RxLR effector protein n=1 Tax=Phytophthora fragariae TaxID=53985 RepID=A0A6A3SA12_9STRA|nr:hypothetical protein PF003_g3503 [Phytophthora fragariae]KAE8937817.1 hypothetical protein PF009_g12279 [Phytophthora fragariae]KAE9005922.1 hypothetical protein PF011_g11821 [Phytophthora fragariae]KAE9112327.1 hypothetical protein PF007_g11146 [Phytophthora fragariae]KAE9112354.1 hypothetical protein PF010_g10474 [Phytophthora fragariae]
MVGAAQLATLVSLLVAGCLRSAVAVALPACDFAALLAVPNGSASPPSLRSATANYYYPMKTTFAALGSTICAQ